MISLGRFSIFVLALTGAAAAAAAEPAADQKLAYQFGRCLVQQDRWAATQVIEQLPLADERVDLSDADLGDASSCLRPEVSVVSSIALRGGIAQELFLRDFQEFGVEPKRKAELATIALPISPDSDEGDPTTRALYRLGDCVVRNSTDSIERLLKAPVGSRTEQQVIERLGPIMAACHGPERQARVSRDDLRSILAQSAYSASTRYWRGQLRAVSQ